MSFWGAAATKWPAFQGRRLRAGVFALAYSLAGLAFGQHKTDVVLAQIEVKRHAPAPDAIGVFFPDLGEPYRKVFTEIIDGIEEQGKARVRGYPIGANQDMGELAGAVKRNGTKVVIALGRQGLKAANSMDVPSGVVISGVSSLPDGDKLIGILLTPDPALLFAQLRTLSPTTRRVFVIYNPTSNDWLIKLARDAARNQGLELVAYEARDLASAARQYEGTFANADSKHDAIWLPVDATTVDETTILPIVLKESWNRSVPVFSSSLLHVKRGVLFALYPNNNELGHSLANLALNMLSGEQPRKGVAPLREVHNALNLRTAGHIGLNVNQKLQRTFDVVYSEP